MVHAASKPIKRYYLLGDIGSDTTEALVMSNIASCHLRCTPEHSESELSGSGRRQTIFVQTILAVSLGKVNDCLDSERLYR